MPVRNAWRKGPSCHISRYDLAPSALIAWVIFCKGFEETPSEEARVHHYFTKCPSLQSSAINEAVTLSSSVASKEGPRIICKATLASSSRPAKGKGAECEAAVLKGGRISCKYAVWHNLWTRAIGETQEVRPRLTP